MAATTRVRRHSCDIPVHSVSIEDRGAVQSSTSGTASCSAVRTGSKPSRSDNRARSTPLCVATIASQRPADHVRVTRGHVRRAVCVEVGPDLERRRQVRTVDRRARRPIGSPDSGQALEHRERRARPAETQIGHRRPDRPFEPAVILMRRLRLDGRTRRSAPTTTDTYVSREPWAQAIGPPGARFRPRPGRRRVGGSRHLEPWPRCGSRRSTGSQTSTPAGPGTRARRRVAQTSPRHRRTRRPSSLKIVQPSNPGCRSGQRSCRRSDSAAGEGLAVVAGTEEAPA